MIISIDKIYNTLCSYHNIIRINELSTIKVGGIYNYIYLKYLCQYALFYLQFLLTS